MQARSEKTRVKATLLFTSTFSVMAGATIAPALLDMQEAFADVDNVEFWVRLVLTLPALFIVIGGPIAGWIVDHYGRKPLLLASTLLYAFSGGSGFIAPDLTTILIGRAVLGLAVAGIVTSVTTMITDYYVGQQRASFLGIQAAFAGIGGTIFLIIGGILVDTGWRNPFLVYLLAFVAVPLIITLLYEHRQTNTHTQSTLADNPPMITEIPFALMIFIYSTMMLIQVIFNLIPVEFSFYLNDLVGADGSTAGLAIAGLATFYALGSLNFKRINARFANIQILTLALTIVGVGYIAIGSATGWPLLIIGLPLAGGGFGLIVPNLTVWMANSVPDHLRGRALGLLTASLFLGQFISPIVLQPIIQATSLSATFQLVGASMIIAGIVGVVRVRQRNHHALAIAKPQT